MIYILEDDNSIRELVTYTLNRSGYEAKGFDLPSLFWAEMEKQMPDLLLLDIMLPEEDGIHILKRLRANSATSQLPVIMLTAKGSEYDRVTGLDSGADDYIPKPFGMMELVARVNALLRRAKPRTAPDEYQVGAIELFRPPSGAGKQRGNLADPQGIRTAQRFDAAARYCFYPGKTAQSDLGLHL